MLRIVSPQSYSVACHCIIHQCNFGLNPQGIRIGNHRNCGNDSGNSKGSKTNTATRGPFIRSHFGLNPRGIMETTDHGDGLPQDSSDADELPSDTDAESPCPPSQQETPLAGALHKFMKQEADTDLGLPSDGSDGYKVRLARPCCTSACTAWILDDTKACHVLAGWDHQMSILKGEKDAEDSIIFNIVRDVVKDGQPHCIFMGNNVCIKGFCKILGIGWARFKKHLTAILSGALEPPTDGRSHRLHDKQAAWHDADSWFHWVWTLVARFANFALPRFVSPNNEVSRDFVSHRNGPCHFTWQKCFAFRCASYRTAPFRIVGSFVLLRTG